MCLDNLYLNSENSISILKRAEEIKRAEQTIAKGSKSISSDVENRYNKSTVGLCFFENSTRTKLSFELAAKRLGMKVLDLAPSTSSINKGEDILDTLLTLEAMGCDFLVIRHTDDDLKEKYSKYLKAHIIIAGLGTSEHPTQALADAFTLLEWKKGGLYWTDEFIKTGLNGLKLGYTGDTLHSRVASSGRKLLSKLGVELFVFSPNGLKTPSSKVKMLKNMERLADEVDIINPLRIQREKLLNIGVTEAFEQISEICQVKLQHLTVNGEYKMLMHPGPINWGVEIDEGIRFHSAFNKFSLIQKQVENGVYVRMAILDVFSRKSQSYSD
ncbi:MAG: aspartate carbamoyltransferase catalytic subunit [Candidatus Kapaibacteriales bacterium]